MLSTIAIANTNGLRSCHTSTQAKLLTVMTGEDRASGYAQAVSTDIGAIDAAAVGAEAADKAARSAGATDLEPGAYDVILEEYAVQTILEYLSYAGFSALAVEEGRSFMDLGNRVMGDNVSLWDDGTDATGLPSASDFEGVAKQRVDLVTDGIATAVVHDTATARRAGVEPTGHALPAPNTFGPHGLEPVHGAGLQLQGDDAVIDRARDLGHALPLREHRPSAQGGAHRHDQGRHLPDRERPHRATHPQPAVHGGDPRRLQPHRGDRRPQTKMVGAEYSGINARVPALRIGRFAFTGATSAESGA